MHRFLAVLGVLLLLLCLFEPLLPPPAVPAWPGRVTTGEATLNATPRPAESLSAGLLRSPPPAAGSVFREAILQPPASLIPLLPGGENDVTRLLFRGLARLDDNGRPVPDLAAGWVQNGGTDWTVRLNPGLRWHDGQPVTAQDVVFTFTAAAHPGLQSLAGDGAPFETVRRRARLWAGRRVEATDDLTVRITLDQTDASLPYDLTLPLMPAHSLTGLPDPRDWAASAFAAAPVGTGFFRWDGDAVQAGDGTIVLTAFNQDGLWPALAGYQFIRVASSDEAWQALQAGKLDGATFELPPSLEAEPAAAVLKQANQLHLQSAAVPGTEALLLLWSPLSDAALRQAVARALESRDTEALRQAAASLDQLSWAPGPDGWRHRDGQTLQVLLDFSAGPTTRIGRRKEAIAALVRPLRGLGIQVLASREPTSPDDRQRVALAAQLVFWESGKDPDLANLVAAIPDAPGELLRLAAEPHRLLPDAASQSRRWALGYRLRQEALVTQLAQGQRIFVFRRDVPQEDLAWFIPPAVPPALGPAADAGNDAAAGASAR